MVLLRKVLMGERRKRCPVDRYGRLRDLVRRVSQAQCSED